VRECSRGGDLKITRRGKVKRFWGGLCEGFVFPFVLAKFGIDPNGLIAAPFQKKKGGRKITVTEASD